MKKLVRTIFACCKLNGSSASRSPSVHSGIDAHQGRPDAVCTSSRPYAQPCMRACVRVCECV
jgi:hypothetical protein